MTVLIAWSVMKPDATGLNPTGSRYLSDEYECYS
jgi:hypothetical protein